jgi:hypothetical protein
MTNAKDLIRERREDCDRGARKGSPSIRAKLLGVLAHFLAASGWIPSADRGAHRYERKLDKASYDVLGPKCVIVADAEPSVISIHDEKTAEVENYQADRDNVTKVFDLETSEACLNETSCGWIVHCIQM